MLIIVGAIIVLGSTLGGFMLAGGNPVVLLHLSEFVVIFGGLRWDCGDRESAARIKRSDTQDEGGDVWEVLGKTEYFDLLKMLYEIFMVGRRNGSDGS